jgi:hypothetical protein
VWKINFSSTWHLIASQRGESYADNSLTDEPLEDCLTFAAVMAMVGTETIPSEADICTNVTT